MTHVLTIKTASVSKVEQNGYKFCLNLGQAKKYLEMKFRNSENSQFFCFIQGTLTALSFQNLKSL